MVHACMYKFALMTWPWYDEEHKVKNNWEGGLKDEGLFDFQLLLLISDNYKFGPRDDERKWLHQETLEAVYGTKHPRDVPTILALCPNMVDELESADVMVFPREQDIEQEVWAFLKERNRAGRTGRRVSMCRFGAPTHSGRHNNLFWTVDLFETTIVAIENDMAKGKKFTEKITLTAGASEGVGESGSTNPHHITIEDRSLRNCCQNNVVARMMTLQEYHHQRASTIIEQCSSPFEKHLANFMKGITSVGRGVSVAF